MSENRESNREGMQEQLGDAYRRLSGLMWYVREFHKARWDEKTYADFTALAKDDSRIPSTEEELHKLVEKISGTVEKLREFAISHGVDESDLSDDKLRGYNVADHVGEAEVLKGGDRFKLIDYFNGEDDKEPH